MLKLIKIIKKIFKSPANPLGGFILAWLVSRAIGTAKSYCERQGVDFDLINKEIEDSLVEVMSEEGFDLKWEKMKDQAGFINDLVLDNVKKVLPSLVFSNKDVEGDNKNPKFSIVEKLDRFVRDLAVELKKQKDGLESKFKDSDQEEWKNQYSRNIYKSSIFYIELFFINNFHHSKFLGNFYSKYVNIHNVGISINFITFSLHPPSIQIPLHYTGVI